MVLICVVLQIVDSSLRLSEPFVRKQMGLER